MRLRRQGNAEDENRKELSRPIQRAAAVGRHLDTLQEHI